MKKENSTKLVRSGLKRTEFMETSEPLFLTSGFVYNSAEEAEDAGEDDEGIPSVSLITALISIGLLAIFRRK